MPGRLITLIPLHLVFFLAEKRWDRRWAQQDALCASVHISEYELPAYNAPAFLVAVICSDAAMQPTDYGHTDDPEAHGASRLVHLFTQASPANDAH
jgi:hypothetical protein